MIAMSIVAYLLQELVGVKLVKGPKNGTRRSFYAVFALALLSC